MSKKRKESYSAKLKKKNWFQWKAGSLRSSWRGRAKKLGIDLYTVPSRLEIQIWLEAQQPFKCYITKEELHKNDIEVDHRVPTSRSGEFTLENIGLTSSKMNKSKGNLSEKEFLELLKLISKWEDSGEMLLARLRSSNNIFRRR